MAETTATTGEASAKNGDGPETKKPRTAEVTVPPGLTAFHHIDEWYEANKSQFSPPVCNRLMHRGQLSIMFVGGPNTRKDFHLEEGSEFFYQIRGNIELPTVQNGKRKLVKINQGQIFCLPSRIPHSPQRPMEGSFGLVIERRREPGEMDGLVFYEDFETCDKVRWEQFFKCEDLGKDLPPVIGAYKAFEASDEAKQPQEWPDEKRPVRQNRTTEVPPPFNLSDFLLAHDEHLASGKSVPLLGAGHPDGEFKVKVWGGPARQRAQPRPYETWLYQIRGEADVVVADGRLRLTEGCCCIVESGVRFEVERSPGSIGMCVGADPIGNKQQDGSDQPVEGEDDDDNDEDDGDDEEAEEEDGGDAAD